MRPFTTFFITSFLKVRKHKVPLNQRIKKCCQLLHTGFAMVDWPKARSFEVSLRMGVHIEKNIC